MSNTKHTPGPWLLKKEENDDRGYWYRPIEAGDSLRVMVYTDGCTVDADEAEANAKLISAAPEMLEALIQINGAQAWISDHKVKSLWDKYVVPAIQQATQ
jgi:hypothetical protein